MLPLLAAIPVMIWSFDDGPGGFVEGGDTLQWEWGMPNGGPGPGDACWATRLGADYFNDATDTLEVQLPDLTAVVRPVLTVRHWYDIRSGDLGTFEVDPGTGWEPLVPIFGYPSGTPGFTGVSGGWIDTSVDLQGYGPTPRVRFVFDSDASVSAAGWFLSDVGLYDGDVTAPRITPVLLPADTEVVAEPYTIQLEVEDDTAVAAVTLFWRENLGPEQSVSMADTGGGLYQGAIPPTSADTIVSWYAVADDGEQTSAYPELGSESFRVYLEAPTDLAPTAEGRIVGSRAELEWDPPTSIHPVVSYRIEAVDGAQEGPWVVFDTIGSVPLKADGARTFQVRAVYGVGIGDPSNAVLLAAEVPQISSVWPPAAWQGDHVRVQLRGSDLYLTQEAASLGFGAGIRVEQVEVVDVDRAVALIAIDEAAAPGPRDLRVSSSWGSVSFPEVFSVIDGADAPQVVSVSPSTVTQGETTTIQVTASQPFYGPVVVDPAEGLLLVSDAVVEGEVATVELVVAGDAPAGPATLVLDDGSRLWTADLVVKERVYRGQTGCGGCNGAPFGPGFASWLLLLAALRTRFDQARRLHPALSRRSRRNGRGLAQ